MTQAKKRILDIQRGDVYLAEFDNSVGAEISGPHPIVVIQNNTGNYHSNTVIGVPITSKTKKTYLSTHVLLKSDVCAGSMAIAEQIHTLDKQRLSRYYGRLNTDEMEKIDAAVRESLNLGASDEEKRCLCSKCLQNYFADPGISIRRVDRYQIEMDLCSYCCIRPGYDYWIGSSINRKK